MRIDDRTLNRVTLARQLLLRRHPVPALDGVGRLVGLQAQAVHAPYLGLWTRLSNSRRDGLTTLLEDRQIVRSSTIAAGLAGSTEISVEVFPTPPPVDNPDHEPHHCRCPPVAWFEGAGGQAGGHPQPTADDTHQGTGCPRHDCDQQNSHPDPTPDASELTPQEGAESAPDDAPGTGAGGQHATSHGLAPRASDDSSPPATSAEGGPAPEAMKPGREGQPAFSAGDTRQAGTAQALVGEAMEFAAGAGEAHHVGSGGVLADAAVESAASAGGEIRRVSAGRALIREALRLVPEGEPVFAAVAPGNARSLRAFLAEGFVPIGSEVIIQP